MSKSRGNVVSPWDVIEKHGADAFRWYYLRPAAVGRLPLLHRDARRERPRRSSTRSGTRTGSARSTRTREGLGPADLDGLEPATEIDRWPLSRLQATIGAVTDGARGLRRHRGKPRPRRVRRRALQLVRAPSRAAASGRASPRLSRPFATACSRRRSSRGAVHPVHRRGDLLQPRRRRRRRRSASARTPCTCATSRRRTPRCATPSSRPRWRPSGEPSSSATPPAPQSRLKIRQPLAQGVIVSRPTRSGDGSRRLAELVQAELNVKELEFVAEESELVSYEVKPNYRALGPRFGKDMPQVAAAVGALDAEHVRRHGQPGRRGRDQHRRHASTCSEPTTSPSSCSRSRATRSRPTPGTRSRWSSSSTTSCAARAWRARSSTPSRTRARTPGSR